MNAAEINTDHYSTLLLFCCYHNEIHSNGTFQTSNRATLSHLDKAKPDGFYTYFIYLVAFD